MINNFNTIIRNFVSNELKDTSSFNFIHALKQEQNWKFTENQAIAKKSTCNKLYNLFALGSAYRSRSEADCVLLFKEAYLQSPEYALKCLWYLRDIIEGQGERRFFRVCLRWLATYDKAAVLRNMKYIPEMGRWDDLYTFVDTPCEEAAFNLIKQEIADDLENYKYV